MTTFQQWSYGDGQRGILPVIKKSIISYEKAAHLSLDYFFANHAQSRVLCNDMLTKTFDFPGTGHGGEVFVSLDLP